MKWCSLLCTLLVGCGLRPVNEKPEDTLILSISPDERVLAEHGEQRSVRGDLEHWGITVPTIQLVNTALDPQECPSGWTNLAHSALQAKNVKRFRDLRELGSHIPSTRPLFESVMKTVQLEVVWPCWVSSQKWRDDFVELVRKTQEVGWNVEIVLLHYDSYPAYLDVSGRPGASGWANSHAPRSFTAYARNVLNALQGALPSGTRVIVASDPIRSLYEGYLGDNNSWPPGADRDGEAFVRALHHLAEGLRGAAKVVRELGFKSAITQNIRPFMGDASAHGAGELDRIWNTWLLDALVSGCVDEDFDGRCERREERVIDSVGISYYGFMSLRESDQAEEVYIGTWNDQQKFMALPRFNFSPDVNQFRAAVQSILERYKDYEHLEIGIGEIGFTSTDTDKQSEWLILYKSVIEELRLPFARLHTMVETAEFTECDTAYHLVKDCFDYMACELTPWGYEAVRQLGYYFFR